MERLRGKTDVGELWWAVGVLRASQALTIKTGLFARF
jgi:hypothetical protein